jgi:hypothetical protein
VADDVGPDRPRWNDEVNTLVHGLLSPQQIEAAREGLISWYRRSRAPDVALYVTPDGDFLTPRRLAVELGAETELGQSYLEIFLAGVLTDRRSAVAPAERIDEVVGMLRDTTGEPWPFS